MEQNSKRKLQGKLKGVLYEGEKGCKVLYWIIVSIEGDYVDVDTEGYF